MFASEEMCTQLYSYISNQVPYEGTLQHYYDSEHYKLAKNEQGGEGNLKWDIFISASTVDFAV